MAADIRVKAVGFDHHRHSVPADVAFYASLDFTVAGIKRLFFAGDRIDIWRADRIGNFYSRLPQSARELIEEERGLFRLFVL